MIPYIIGLVWGLSGIWSFIYWWTKYHDFGFSIEIILAIMASSIGPFAFLAGWMIHGDGDVNGPVIFKKRK